MARLIRQGNRLKRSHPVRAKILEFLRTLKCEGEGRLLRCCDPSDPRVLKKNKEEETTTKAQVKEEKETTTEESTKSNTTDTTNPVSSYVFR